MTTYRMVPGLVPVPSAFDNLILEDGPYLIKLATRYLGQQKGRPRKVYGKPPEPRFVVKPREQGYLNMLSKAIYSIHQWGGRFTACVLTVPKSEGCFSQHVGIARSHPDDKFELAIGSSIALRRAIRAWRVSWW